MGSTTTSTPPALELTRFIEGVSQRLAEHADAPLWTAPGRELTDLTVAVEKLRAQVDATALAVVREVDRRQAAKDLGAPTTTAWLRNGPTLMGPREASKTVKLGKDLDQTLHATRHALTAGELSLDHAQVIATVITKLPSDVDAATRVKAEEELVRRAKQFNPPTLAIVGKTILDVVAPDLADALLAKQLEDEEKKANRARELTLSPDHGSPGSYRLRGKLDPETAELLRTCLDPLAKPRPKDATGERDARSHPERMGDALHEFLRQTLNRGDLVPTSGGNPPNVVITISGRQWGHRHRLRPIPSLPRTRLPAAAAPARLRRDHHHHQRGHRPR